MPNENDKPQIVCPQCEGCGRVDSKEGKPWSEITRMPNQEVRAGFITPKVCDKCAGFGNIEKPAEPAPAPVEENQPQQQESSN